MTGSPDRDPVPRPDPWWRHRETVLSLGLVLACVFGALALYLIEGLAPPAPAAQLRQGLADKLAESQAVLADLAALWDRLEAGQSVPCDTELAPRPYFVDWRGADQAAHPTLAALADQLNDAIRDLHDVADTWTAACQGDNGAIIAGDAAAVRAILDRVAAQLTAIGQALASFEA